MKKSAVRTLGIISAWLALGWAGALNAQGTAGANELLIVSLGDSYAAGEGNPDVRFSTDGPARWRGGNDLPDALWCHRSDRNAHRIAFDRLAMQWNGAAPGRSAAFKSFACGGAAIGRGLLQRQFGYLGDTEINFVDCPDNPDYGSCHLGQIERLVQWQNANPQSPRQIDAVLISIGGNDLLLADAVKEFSFSAGGTMDMPSRSLMQRIAEAINNLPGQLDVVIDRINREVRPRHIFFVEYPDPLRNERGQFCGGSRDVNPIQAIGHVLAGDLERARRMSGFISQHETSLAFNSILLPLNRALRDAAARHANVTLVTGIQGATRNNGYCAPSNRRLFHTFVDSFAIQGDPYAALHPNPDGTRRLSDRIVAQLRGPLLTVPVSSPRLRADELKGTNALKPFRTLK